MKIEIIEPTMKKVFKQELQALEKYQQIASDLNLSETDIRQHFHDLLNEYRLLLQDAIKITAIGDINQKKLYDAFEELEKQRAILYQSSITDHLTQVHNRPYIMKMFEDIFLQGKHHCQIFSCILLDIDDFKNVNDNHGHLIGDKVLKETAKHIANQLRKTDMIGRYGGEEFLIILPNTNIDEARQVAEKIRKSVEFANIGEKNLKVTISLGVCDNQINNHKNQQAMLHKVDYALYQAKNRGKNQVIVYKSD